LNALRSPAKWGDAYAESLPLYEAFTDRLEGLVETLLDDEEIDYHYIVDWNMSRRGFIDRIYRTRRDGKPLHDPLSEWTDLHGISIVALTLTGLDAIARVIEHEFDVDEQASTSVGAAAVANQHITPSTGDEIVTYTYAQLVISLPESRSALAEWHDFGGLRVQVDIKTRLQAEWEETRNELPYFRASSLPDDVRHTLVEAARRTNSAGGSVARAPGVIADVARIATDRGFTPYGVRNSILAWLLLVLNRADAETVAVADFYEEIEFALNTLSETLSNNAKPSR
jgi:ppGpp synthetase/RelA/SpoT-type nucleotidyltranferase